MLSHKSAGVVCNHKRVLELFVIRQDYSIFFNLTRVLEFVTLVGGDVYNDIMFNPNIYPSLLYDHVFIICHFPMTKKWIYCFPIN